jgi:hypothetical protein
VALGLLLTAALATGADEGNTALDPAPAAAGNTPLAVAGKTLTMAAPARCAKAAPSRRRVARYLSQYDPAGEPKQDSSDETPWTKKEVALIKRALVEQGFHYPNGQESVITWMDFDGDGTCDFTASAGVGGMYAIDRFFLFRGLQKGGFKLADADLTYMEGSIAPVPYIPVTVSGRRLPMLVKKDSLMLWQPDRRTFATCDSVKYGLQPAKKSAAAKLMIALCPRQQDIYSWAAGQLAHGNGIIYSPASPEVTQ